MKKNKTKIVCTIGPSSNDFKTLSQMAEAGMDIARINMSHGDIAFYKKIVQNIRKIHSKKILIMTDTKGPEIRIGDLKKPLDIKKNSLITINTNNFKCPKMPNTFYVYDSTKKYNMAKDLKKGNKIFVDDGKLTLITKTVDVKNGIIKAQALNDHIVISNKRINLPDSKYTMPFLSEKDKESLINSIKLKADCIALSFVNDSSNVKDVRNILNKNGGKEIKLISKIETQQALDNIKDIIKVSDGIMIARGDLALETPF